MEHCILYVSYSIDTDNKTIGKPWYDVDMTLYRYMQDCIFTKNSVQTAVKDRRDYKSIDAVLLQLTHMSRTTTDSVPELFKWMLK